MMRRASVRLLFLAVAATGVAVVACSSSKSTGPKLTPQQLVGTYTLDTLSTAAGTATPPAVNGTLVLTDSTYHEHVVAATGPSPSDTMQLSADSGTYSISGSTFTQTSQTGQPSVTATASVRGTNGDTLDVIVTSPAQAAGTYVWVKTT
jgi:hypothetical protein